VRAVSAQELHRFTDNLHYLRLLLMTSAPVSPLQVLAANVREVYRERGNDRVWLDAAAREIATLLKNDHEALLTVLYAIDPDEVPTSAESRHPLGEAKSRHPLGEAKSRHPLGEAGRGVQR
jgi:hypothetical protein